MFLTIRIRIRTINNSKQHVQARPPYYLYWRNYRSAGRVVLYYIIFLAKQLQP